MENKTNKNQKQSGVSPAVRIGSLIMAGLMVLGAFGTFIYAFFS